MAKHRAPGDRTGRQGQPQGKHSMHYTPNDFPMPRRGQRSVAEILLKIVRGK